MTSKEILGQALNLSPEDRAKLVLDIISSLDGPPDNDVERAWVDEIERRVKEVQDGTVELLEWEEVRKRIEARLASQR